MGTVGGYVNAKDVSASVLANSQTSETGAGPALDLVVFSHLRWDFVLQRPQHLLSRCAQGHRVFFVEEPVMSNDTELRLDVSTRDSGVTVVIPRLPEGLVPEEVDRAQRALVDGLFAEQGISDYAIWYYTPMALPFTEHLRPRAIIFDVMDELSAFKNAPPELLEREARLLAAADVVFTGGQSLYEAKRDRNANVHAFPSSIDAKHFGKGREEIDDPADQAEIPHPRLGFFGVIDERLDVELVGAAADLRPDWHFVIIGPVVKIDPATLPQRPNVHYLGGKDYKDLPAYLGNWDVAIMPFALNDSTRYISPTKTPEYLAAGKPVVSTSIRDVVRPYGEQGLVEIADTPEAFVAAAEKVLAREGEAHTAWLNDVDALLAKTSWDMTWQRMWRLIEDAARTRATATAHSR